ncbi:MAG: ABC transporter permease subunit [Gammaproteobacteria bacterium]|nr:ABC transporter permease subunit [Gammaproteobacteria bacterium]
MGANRPHPRRAESREPLSSADFRDKFVIFTIAWRELRNLFLTPLAWTLLALATLILGYLFLSQVDLFVAYQPQLANLATPPGVTEVIVSPLYANGATIIMLMTPLLTMRLLSEERSLKTLPLLISAPITATQIVLGKYLGVLAFLSILIALMTTMPLAISLLTPLDTGLLLSCVCGLLLFSAALAAAGLFLSALAPQPAVAAISTLGLILLLWIIDLAGNGIESGTAAAVIRYLSLQHHLSPLLQGHPGSENILFYLLFSALFIFLSCRHLDHERWQG